MTYFVSGVFVFLLFTGFLGRISFLTYLVFIFSTCSATALLPPELLGGANITPGSAAALFFIAKALSTRSVFKESMRSMRDFRQLGYLSLFLLVGIIGCYILPRVFEGAVYVYSMKTAQLEFVAPSMANYTQTIYLALSTLTAVVTAVLARNERFVEMLPKAILAGAYAAVITGLLDAVANLVGLGDVLGYFRNASYAFMTNNYLEGTRRIIGFTPEASSYGSVVAGFCGLLLFMRPVYTGRLWRWHVPLTAWACGLMALLSTSSTAYVMMAVILLIYAFYDVHKVTSDGKVIKKTISKKILAFLGAGVLCLLILVFDSELATRFANLVDLLIFQKQKSSSYADRSHMTQIAFEAFLATYGLGVGIGSARASNFFVSILASTGIVGGGLFLMFLWVIFTRRAAASEVRDNVMIRATKLSLLPMFVGSALAGTTPDFGPVQGLLFGLITGLAQPPIAPAWLAPRFRKTAEAKPASGFRKKSSPREP